VQNFVKTRFSCRPVVVFEVHNWEFFKHAVGPLAGAGTTVSHYTITEADTTGVTTSTTIIPFSMECGSIGATDDTDTYTGCFVDSFTLDLTFGGVVTCTANLIAQKVTSSTTSTAYTPPTTHPWVMTHEGTFKWGATPTAVTGIRDVSITYNNNMIVYGDWNTVFIAMPEAGQRTISFKATMVMTSTIATTLRDDFYGQANVPIDSALTAEPTADKELWVELSQGAASTNRNANIFLNQCMIDSISKPISTGNDDVVLVTVTGRAKTSGCTASANVLFDWYTTT
jgi:hypothetical protein